MNQSPYVLVVDQAWAKLYRIANPSLQLALVYHQALFVGRPASGAEDDELARGLCRILRADRQTGKYKELVILASDGMVAALRKHYDGDWHDVTVGRIGSLPPRYADDDVAAQVRRLLTDQRPLSQEETTRLPAASGAKMHD